MRLRVENMLNKKGLGILCAIAVFMLAACKDPNNVGIGVLPQSDLVGMVYTDTTTIDLETQLIDSITTVSAQSDIHVFGNYLDPAMGSISAGTYTQFRFPNTKLDLGSPDSLRLDSIVLKLDVVGFFGRIETPQTMRVYEIAQNFDDTLKYSSKDSLLVKSKDLANGKIINKNTSVLTNVSVRLDNSIGERLLFAPKDSTIDNAMFLKYFKGLYFDTSPIKGYTSREPGAIMNISLHSGDTRLVLYYSQKDSSGTFPKDNNKNYSFNVTSASKKFHTFKRSNFNDLLLGKELFGGEPAHNYEFIQSGTLSQILVKIPHIAALGKVAINKAELVFPCDPSLLGVKLGNSYRYSPPDLDMFYPDSTLRKPEKFFVDATIGVSFNATTATYTIPITNTLQGLVNGAEENRGFLIRPSSSSNLIANTPNRVILGGVNNTAYKPKLRIIYTTLPK